MACEYGDEGSAGGDSRRADLDNGWKAAGEIPEAAKGLKRGDVDEMAAFSGRLGDFGGSSVPVAGDAALWGDFGF